MWCQSRDEFFRRTMHFSTSTADQVKMGREYMIWLLFLLGREGGLKGRRELWRRNEGRWTIRADLASLVEKAGEYVEGAEHIIAFAVAWELFFQEELK